MLVVAVACPSFPTMAVDSLWLADRVRAWLEAARAGLDPARQRHFLATLGPDLVRAFQAEEADLVRLGPWAAAPHRSAHRALVQRLSLLLREASAGRDLSPGIEKLLEEWLRHHRLEVPGVRQSVAGTGN